MNILIYMLYWNFCTVASDKNWSTVPNWSGTPELMPETTPTVDVLRTVTPVTKSCFKSQDFRKLPAEYMLGPKLVQRIVPCDMLSGSQKNIVLCAYYSCYIQEIDNHVPYPHKKCYRQAPNYETYKASMVLNISKTSLGMFYPSANIDLLFKLQTELQKEKYCGKDINQPRCFASKLKQYSVLWSEYKYRFIELYFDRFHGNTDRIMTKDIQVHYPLFPLMKPFITAAGLLLAVVLGIFNIKVVKTVLNECKDNASRVYHYSEICLNFIQILVSGIAGLNWDRFLSVIWIDLCQKPRSIISVSKLKIAGADDSTFVAELISWGFLVSSQLSHTLLMRDRFTAVHRPLEYNKRGPQEGKKARRVIVLATIVSLSVAMLEICAINLVQERNKISKSRYQCVRHTDYVKIFVRTINFPVIVVFLVAQIWYLVRTRISWIKFQKLMMETADGTEERITYAEAEHDKLTQKFFLVLGPWILSILSISPWVLHNFLRLSDTLCVVFMILDCPHSRTMPLYCIPRLSHLYPRGIDITVEIVSIIWPIFLICNCLNVVVYVIFSETYKTGFFKMLKGCCKKTKEVSPDHLPQLRRSSRVILPEELEKQKRKNVTRTKCWEGEKR